MIVVVAPCLSSRVSEYGALTSLCLGGPRNTTAFSHIYPIFFSRVELSSLCMMKPLSRLPARPPSLVWADDY